MAYMNRCDLSNLTNEELCVRYQSGDNAALDMLCRKNVKLIYKIATKAMKDYNPTILDLEDLYMEGNFGLMTAAKKFDINRGCKFTTIAFQWVKQYVVRSIMNDGYGLTLPIHMVEKITKINKCRKKLDSDSPKEIMIMMKNEYGANYSISQIEKCLYYADKYHNVISLNKTIDENEDNKHEILSYLSDEEYMEENSFNRIMQDVIREDVRKALCVLSEKERNVIIMRFGIGRHKSMTLEEVGKELGVTRERIRQIEKAALTKLRDMKGEELHELLIA